MDELDQIERKCKEVMALRKKRDRYNKPIADAEKELSKEWDRVKGGSDQIKADWMIETDDQVEGILKSILLIKAGRGFEDQCAPLPDDLGT